MPFISDGSPQDTVYPITYSASLFGATGGGTWTVLPADVHTMQYWQFGRFVHLDVDLNGGLIAGLPPSLTLKLPFIAPSDNGGSLVIDPAGNPRSGFTAIAGGTNVMQLFPVSGNWTNGVTPLTFEISIIL